MSCKDNLNIFNRFTYSVVTNTESFFYKLGTKIAKKPLTTILICWALVFVCAFGFLRFHQEKSPLKLWVPPHTSFIKDSEWLVNTLEMGFRIQSVIIKSDNVLSPKILSQLNTLHDLVQTSKSASNITWKDVCFKIPKLNTRLMSFFNNDRDSDQLDASTKINAALYCSFVEAVGTECLEKSILELWNFNKTLIQSLSNDDILNAINTYDKSFILNRLKNYEDLLGGIERNETGHIISARSLNNVWLANLNFSAVDMDKVGNKAGTAEWATEDVLQWERDVFLNVVANQSQDYNNNSFFYAAGRSDISEATMFKDMDKLVFGIFIMVLYVQFIISKFNCVENRILLASVGMLTIAMAFITGCGLCSLLGVYYGPVHTSLPFLLMGLGVDDMLVIIACWDDIHSNNNKQTDLPHRIGLMLKHAGVSITVTSITDVVAFIIGSSTILPCLQSFCIYAAVCVFMIYIFALTFFTACFCLDQKRLESNRNGIIPTIQYPSDYKKNECSQLNLTNEFFHILYDKIILTRGGKIVVVAITVICLAFSVQSVFKLEKHFEPAWFIPKQTYLAEYMAAKREMYPKEGLEGGLYFGALNYTKEFRNIKAMSDQLANETEIVTNVFSWVDPFRDFVLLNFKEDLYYDEVSEERFHTFLSMFLFSTKFAKYQASFQFDRKLECGAPAPKIMLSSIDFNFFPLTLPHQFIPAMHKVRAIVDQGNLTSGDRFATVWSKVFTTWLTDELIDIEVVRNLELALLCVMGCTILLVADFQICFWIFCSVLITMINVCGFMQLWGLTIDLVTCIGLELAIGLCVDYATHVGHTFLTIQNGDRRERALTTVRTIGSAVLYGGLSTLIGVFMLCLSDAYTFQSFFKIFVLVILFGLFHGIVLLPCVLSTIGPRPYERKIVPQFETELN